MINIYIDKNLREITIKDKKDKIIKQYTNVSTKNTIGILRSIKLITYSLNKIFNTKKHYNEESYMFYVNDEELIKYIKDKNNLFYTKVNSDWRENINDRIYSELGGFLSIFKKIQNKDIVYWERDELFELRDEKEKLYIQQSICDKEIQCVLHDIQKFSDMDINEVTSIKYIYKIRKIRKEREKIKNKIKIIEQKEKIKN